MFFSARDRGRSKVIKNQGGKPIASISVLSVAPFLPLLNNMKNCWPLPAGGVTKPDDVDQLP